MCMGGHRVKAKQNKLSVSGNMPKEIASVGRISPPLFFLQSPKSTCLEVCMFRKSDKLRDGNTINALETL